MPNDETFTLHLSSGWHLTSSTKRLEELPIDSESVDVVFEENTAHNPPDRKTLLLNWFATPFICVILHLYLLGLGFASDRGWTDQGVIDELESLGAEVVKTDRNYHRILATERLFWAVGHWAFILMVSSGLTVWIEFVTTSVLPNRSFGGSLNQ